MNRKYQHLPAATALLLAAFFLRAWHVDTQSLSGDEAFSIINWTRVSLPYVFGTIALIDPQPPFALGSLYTWVRLVGDTPLAARMLSVLASLVTTASGYSIARALADNRTAALTILLLAINPFQIWYAQDIRSYSLWIATSAVAFRALLAANTGKPRASRWIRYALSAAISAYTFYLQIPVLLASAISSMPSFTPGASQRWRHWLGAHLLILLILSPWYFQPSLRNSGYRPTGAMPDIPTALAVLLFGATQPSALTRPLLWPDLSAVELSTLTLLILLGSIAAAQPRFRQATTILVLHAALPLVTLSLLALLTHQGYFHPRYLAATSLPLMLLLSIPMSQHSQQRRYTGLLSIAALAIIITFSLLGTATYRYIPAYAKAPPWPAIMQTLNKQIAPDDLVIRNFPDPAFDYYYTAPATTITQPANADTSAADTYTTLAQATQRHSYIWFLPIDSAAYDRDQIVLTWLDSHLQIISDQWIGPTRLRQYGHWNQLPTPLPNPQNITFEQVAILTGYRLTPPGTTVQAGMSIYLETFWTPIQPTREPLTLFVHLIPSPVAGTPIASQDDHPPQHGRLTTTTWIPGRPFRDVAILTIPTTQSATSYHISIGFYDPVTGKRVPIYPTGADSATLQTLYLNTP